MYRSLAKYAQTSAFVCVHANKCIQSFLGFKAKKKKRRKKAERERSKETNRKS